MARATMYKGYRITAFQQFVGAWLARYELHDKTLRTYDLAGDIGGRTERQAIALCKKEILHINRHAALLARPHSFRHPSRYCYGYYL